MYSLILTISHFNAILIADDFGNQQSRWSQLFNMEVVMQKVALITYNNLRHPDGFSDTVFVTNGGGFYEGAVLITPFTVDKVVIYVGQVDMEKIIEGCRKSEFVPEKTKFIFCGCSLARKVRYLFSSSFSSSEFLAGDCGGHELMSYEFGNATGFNPSWRVNCENQELKTKLATIWLGIWWK